jgi:NTP pyrophosphatase (non-canonical NTP hydrolase)
MNSSQARYDIDCIAFRQWKWVESMGWHKTTVLERLALICSEVGEAVNECRGEYPTDEFGYELADIILRTVDLAHDLNLNIGEYIIDKQDKNEAKENYKNRLK